MFDVEDIYKKQLNKIYVKMKIDTDPIFSVRFRKIIHFIGDKMMLFVLSVASVILFFVIMNRIYVKIGFEHAVIILFCITILSIRGVSKALAHKEE